MDKLVSNQAQLEISNKVVDILRNYHIDDWQSLPKMSTPEPYGGLVSDLQEVYKYHHGADQRTTKHMVLVPSIRLHAAEYLGVQGHWW